MVEQNLHYFYPHFIQETSKIIFLQFTFFYVVEQLIFKAYFIKMFKIKVLEENEEKEENFQENSGMQCTPLTLDAVQFAQHTLAHLL